MKKLTIEQWQDYENKHKENMGEETRKIIENISKGRQEWAQRLGFVQIPPIVNHSKQGRNNPCPCGSLKKYKKCCG